MAIIRTNIGTKPDGTPLFHYQQTDSSTPVVLTGPVSGEVTTADGTTYNVTNDVIEVPEKHAGEVACLIGKRMEAEGHPGHDDGVPFVHECTEVCGGNE